MCSLTGIDVVIECLAIFFENVFKLVPTNTHMKHGKNRQRRLSIQTLLGIRKRHEGEAEEGTLLCTLPAHLILKYFASRFLLPSDSKAYMELP